MVCYCNGKNRGFTIIAQGHKTSKGGCEGYRYNAQTRLCAWRCAFPKHPDSRVCILDFDWAGKKDTVRYTVALNMRRRSVWHPDVKPVGLITKEHDLYQLERIEVVE